MKLHRSKSGTWFTKLYNSYLKNADYRLI